MKKTLAVTCLLWMFIWAGLGVWGACPANNPNNPFAITMQGGDPTGNLGYPIAVVGATGCPLDVNVLSGGGGGCVTQCTSPWIVSSSDGALVTVGSNSDASVIGDTPGTVSAKLRGLLKQIQVATPVTALFGFGLTNPVNLWSYLGYGQLYDQATQTWYPQGGCGTGGAVFSKSAGLVGIGIQDVNSFPGFNQLAAPTAGDGGPGTLIGRTSLPVVAYLRTGADTIQSYDQQRTPAAFKTVSTAAAGNTPVWTPSVGKRFRAMRWRYTITDNATLAAPGVLTITLNDAGAAIGQSDDVFVPAIALLNNGQLAVSPWIDLGNGVLSGAANQALNVNLSAALVTGTVRVQVCGTEE